MVEKKRGGRVGDKKERGESSSERNIACHPLGGKVNWVKCFTLSANCKRRMLNGRLWSTEANTARVLLQEILGKGRITPSSALIQQG